MIADVDNIWARISEPEERHFPRPPRRGSHLYAICRFDGLRAGSDPITRFILTRGYWTEEEANRKSDELNAAVADESTVYFVLPVRVEDPK